MTAKHPTETYRVVVKTECRMIVHVQARSEREALARARQGNYDPHTEWEPVNYGHLRAVDPRKFVS